MAGLVPKGRIEFANDPITADLIKTDTETRAAIRGEVGPLVTQSLTNPAVTTIVTGAVNTAVPPAVSTALAGASVLTASSVTSTAYPNDLVYLGDKDSVPSKVGYDKYGEIADATMASAETKGMPRVVGSGSGVRFQDASGKNFALGFDSTGQFDSTTKWAFVNLVHFYRGMDRPFVWPAGYVDWDHVDSDGAVIEYLRGVESNGTTTWTERPGMSGTANTVVAEDILSKNGGIITSRGATSVEQNVHNGFSLFRQHVGGTGQHRPAPSVGGYPNGLWLQGIGQEADGYGSQDSGGGTYINLDRSREGTYYTQSYWWGLKSVSADAVGQVTFYQDTEGWGSLKRSYFTVQIDLATGVASIRNDAGGYTAINGGSPVPVPGWNDNKFDSTYCSLTTYVGPSTETGEAFGRYIAFQIGGKVFDLRSVGGGSADYEPQVITTGSSFSGGRNPGMSFTNPVAGKRGGVVLYRFLETIGDTVA